MIKAKEFREAVEEATNHARRIDYYKRRLAYDVKKEMAHCSPEDRERAVERGHRLLDQGLSRQRAYYHAYKGVLL